MSLTRRGASAGLARILFPPRRIWAGRFPSDPIIRFRCRRAPASRRVDVPPLDRSSSNVETAQRSRTCAATRHYADRSKGVSGIVGGSIWLTQWRTSPCCAGLPFSDHCSHAKKKKARPRGARLPARHHHRRAPARETLSERPCWRLCLLTFARPPGPVRFSMGTGAVITRPGVRFVDLE
ncbi:hypothetical protein BC628DRAFT_512064 [Trametes gibbosa]|nr:hypothetical protein BC628DRAFT_512064 [Trametes gibbosa]